MTDNSKPFNNPRRDAAGPRPAPHFEVQTLDVAIYHRALNIDLQQELRRRGLEGHSVQAVVRELVTQRGRQLVLEVVARLAGKKGDRIDLEVKYPADWWSAVKARWFPAWLLSRYPAQYKTVSVHADTWRVCPHVAVPRGREHFDFLTGTPTPFEG